MGMSIQERAETQEQWFVACGMWGSEWVTDSLRTLNQELDHIYRGRPWEVRPLLEEREDGFVYADLDGDGDWVLVAVRL